MYINIKKTNHEQCIAKTAEVVRTQTPAKKQEKQIYYKNGKIYISKRAKK